MKKILKTMFTSLNCLKTLANSRLTPPPARLEACHSAGFRELNAFSLMEMMVVLLIIAIIAAATAPMITKKLARNAGSVANAIEYFGLRGNYGNASNDSMIIGDNNPRNNKVFINSNNGDQPQLGFGYRNGLNIVPAGKLHFNGNGGIILGGTNNTAGANALSLGQSAAANGSQSLAIQGTTGNNAGNSIAIHGTANGANSLAIGNGATASGSTSVAIRGTASNDGAIAIKGQASGSNAIAILGTATGTNSVSIRGSASGEGSTALGVSTNATRNWATAVGCACDAEGQGSTAVGSGALARGLGSIAIGNGNSGVESERARATAKNAIAIGAGAAATAENSVAIGAGVTNGRSNVIQLGNANNTIYIPGSLVVDNHTILSNGETGNNARTYVRTGGNYHALQDYNFHENGDRRSWDWNDTVSQSALNPIVHYVLSDRKLKNVGEKFTGGLTELKKLDLYNFTFKKDKDKTPQVGVMAQDLKKIFPNAVWEGSDGYLRIRWDEMFYSVINAIKELDSKIETAFDKIKSNTDKVTELQKKVDAQEKVIADLENRLAKLEKNAK